MAGHRYRVTFMPRVPGPFSQPLYHETSELPRFEGGMVILMEPVEVDQDDDDVQPVPPLYAAWPVDVLGAVIVRVLGDVQ